MEGATKERRRILVIDDDPETARCVRSWYSGRAVEVNSALDGSSGLAALATQRPDIVLLDLRMPGLDGITVAQRLREDPAARSIPVILLTACRDVESKVSAFAAGVDDYVTKPFEFAEVDARIETMLRKRDRMLGLESQVVDLNSSKQQLETLLTLDEKTGLANFREFQRRLSDEWRRSERYGAPLSLVFLDLDHFKQVNDRLGHLAGDRVLREFAMLVTGGARTSDLSARYGGEEFAMVLPHTDGSMAMRVAERVLCAVREFVFCEDEAPTRLTVSAGVATYPTTLGVDSVEALIRAADRALYEAKDRGRDQVVEGAPSTAR